jgi:hypothetical protein
MAGVAMDLLDYHQGPPYPSSPLHLREATLGAIPGVATRRVGGLRLLSTIVDAPCLTPLHEG